MKAKSIIIMLLIFITCCINDPVGEDFFLDTDKIKGGDKPVAPTITEIVSCNDEITITFTCDPDPDGDELSYLFYYSFTDPSEFTDEIEYYNPLRLAGTIEQVASAEFYSGINGTIYFWMTAYDGGRESDHSNVESVDLPGSC